MKEFSGFTLAEVLITLAIIGIVAALTIPIIATTSENGLKVSLKKSFAQISSALNLAAQDNGGTLKGLCSTDSQNCFITTMSRYLAATKTCPMGAILGNCWASAGKWYRGDGAVIASAWESYVGPSMAGLILNNGSYVAIDFGAVCNPYCAYMLIDVNGPKKPNTVSKDIFAFIINEPSRLVPDGTAENSTKACNVNTDNGSFWCTTNVLLEN